MSESSDIDISIIIPTYNASENLVSTIESVIEQRDVKIQLVVIEDGSSFPSKVLLEQNFHKYLEPQCSKRQIIIRYLEQQNAGAYKARLSALNSVSYTHLTLPTKA